MTVPVQNGSLGLQCKEREVNGPCTLVSDCSQGLVCHGKGGIFCLTARGLAMAQNSAEFGRFWARHVLRVIARDYYLSACRAQST